MNQEMWIDSVVALLDENNIDYTMDPITKHLEINCPDKVLAEKLSIRINDLADFYGAEVE